MWSAIPFLLVAVWSAIESVAGRSQTITLKSRAIASNATNDTRWRVSNPRQKRNDSTTVLPVPLTDWFDRVDNQWYSNISIGEPPQDITVLWDTGSNILLIPGSNCTTCGNRTLFNPHSSFTFMPLPYSDTSIEFSTGPDSIPLAEPEGASGIVAIDEVAVGDDFDGLVYEAQAFLLCDEYAPSLARMPIDGIIGLAPQNTSAIGQPSFFWNLWAMGALDAPVFALYIPGAGTRGADTAELTLGGVDPDRFTGDITYLDLSDDPTMFLGQWVLEQTALYINGSADALSPPSASRHPRTYAVLDSGTPFIQTPDYDTARALYARVSPAIRQIDPAGAWGAACDEVERAAAAAEFVFALRGADGAQVNVTLPRAAFNLGEYPGQPSVCQAVFNNYILPEGGQAFWLLGSPLLKAYYTIWDGLNRKVGWAQLKGDEGA
ncbi:aspartic peptidase domain-containing protein [Biscogniauxia mediterranea]|nr:aspartic peptidase domain-containing protein [Biscogniauxia mediterranea]